MTLAEVFDVLEILYKHGYKHIRDLWKKEKSTK
jgi:hypothetical protein